VWINKYIDRVIPSGPAILLVYGLRYLIHSFPSKPNEYITTNAILRHFYFLYIRTQFVVLKLKTFSISIFIAAATSSIIHHDQYIPGCDGATFINNPSAFGWTFRLKFWQISKRHAALCVCVYNMRRYTTHTLCCYNIYGRTVDIFSRGLLFVKRLHRTLRTMSSVQKAASEDNKLKLKEFKKKQKNPRLCVIVVHCDVDKILRNKKSLPIHTSLVPRSYSCVFLWIIRRACKCSKTSINWWQSQFPCSIVIWL
jgi:hypothetical protein